MLVSSGFGYEGYYQNTEVLNLDSKDGQAPTYQNHSEALEGATGGFIANQFVTCGGYIGGEDILKECYKIGTTNTSLHGKMKERRFHAASIALADRLWILGGRDGNSNFLKSTEYILHDGRQEDGPDMPIGLVEHAVIQINETSFMLVGGSKQWVIKNERTYFYCKARIVLFKKLNLTNDFINLEFCINYSSVLGRTTDNSPPNVKLCNQPKFNKMALQILIKVITPKTQ